MQKDFEMNSPFFRFAADKVFAESAYVYSLSLAVITHTVARGCSQNIINNCSCSADSETATVCPDNVEYGLQIAETFLHMRFSSTGGGPKQEIAHHNFLATRHVSNHLLLAVDQFVLAGSSAAWPLTN